MFTLHQTLLLRPPAGSPVVVPAQAGPRGIAHVVCGQWAAVPAVYINIRSRQRAFEHDRDRGVKNVTLNDVSRVDGLPRAATSLCKAVLWVCGRTLAHECHACEVTNRSLDTYPPRAYASRTVTHLCTCIACACHWRQHKKRRSNGVRASKQARVNSLAPLSQLSPARRDHV